MEFAEGELRAAKTVRWGLCVWVKLAFCDIGALDTRVAKNKRRGIILLLFVYYYGMFVVV
jgi:hypothetical protein